VRSKVLSSLHALEELYDTKFRPVNSEFKQIATNWQMKTSPDGSNVLNDHTDKEYDRKVITSLFELHERVKKITPELTALYPETQGYVQRLEAALEKVKQGDDKYFTGVTVDSYHTAWYEFHFELLKKLGREGKLSPDEV